MASKALTVGFEVLESKQLNLMKTIGSNVSIHSNLKSFICESLGTPFELKDLNSRF